MEVVYRLNGKLWSDSNLFVSASRNLIGKLKPKSVLEHDWHEYHGKQYDLAIGTRYEERKITLDIFVVGDNWDEVVTNYHNIMDEFDKVGLQNLAVIPFENKPLLYNVFLEGATELRKVFRNGEMFGTASLSMIEPSPIKRILRTKNTTLNLTFTTDYLTDVVVLDDKFKRKNSYSQKGNVSVTLPLDAKERYIIISGNIETFTNFTTNAITLWSKI